MTAVHVDSFEQCTIVRCRPLGTLSFTLSHIELADPAHSFAVITCGPHWGLTPVVAQTDKPWFNWQVCHLTPYARIAMLISCGTSKGGQLQAELCAPEI